MLHGEPLQLGFACRRQKHEHLAPIRHTLLAANQPLRLRAVNQPNHTVLAHLQALGQLGDAGVVSSGEALDREQQLMLLGCHPFASCRLFAKAQEAPDRIAKRGDGLIVRAINNRFS